jgi:Fic family protein
MYNYSQPSSANDAEWKREFIHEIDQLVIEITREKKVVEEALASKSSANDVYASFSQNSKRVQQRAGQELLEAQEQDETAQKYVSLMHIDLIFFYSLSHCVVKRLT